jgi:hypothetical protein
MTKMQKERGSVLSQNIFHKNHRFYTSHTSKIYNSTEDKIFNTEKLL